MVSLKRILFSALILAGSDAEALDCPKVISSLSQKFARRGVSAEVLNYDTHLASEAKSRYQAVLKGKSPMLIDDLPQTLEDRIGLVDALFGNAGKMSPDFGKFMESEPGLKRVQAISKLLEKTDFKHGMTAVETDKFVEKLLVLQRGDPSKLLPLVKNGINEQTRLILRARIEKEVATQSLIKALGKLGLLREPEGLDGARAFASQNRVAVTTVMTSVMNGATVFLSGVPGYIPDISKLRNTKFTAELTEKAIAEGFDAIYPDLYALYGQDAHFDMMWSTMRKSFTTGIVTYFGYKKYESAQEKARKEIAEAEKNGKQLDEGIQSTGKEIVAVLGTPETFDEKLFNDWKEAYRQHYGVDPDSNSEDYKKYRHILLKD